ncbi:transcription termination/antitermination protein NusG [Mesorhizobium marinum]|uniref:Transcription termination/antitermination protein NusG n=1 Tax=Mesorhizobium marinum TaxID=3228790 RepID=A0ABV3R7R8_9HYPH
MKISVAACMTISVDDKRWFVLRVRAGMEDEIFEKLTAKGYDVYLPRRRFDKHNRQQRVWVEKHAPLMPGYMFIVHPRKDRPVDDWREVVGDPHDPEIGIAGVLGPLKGHEGPLRIPAPVVEIIIEEEFGSVYDETAAGKRARGDTGREKLEYRFARGRRFQVDDGPFASFIAEVDKLTHDDRVIALIDIFGRMTPVEFDPDRLKDTPRTPGSKAA